MGNRADLLEGAKRCLYEKGYARTTARDIVAASGTNLASIGYHFGSKEALLNAALIEALEEMSAELSDIGVRLDPRLSAWEQVADAWARSIGEFERFRPLLVSQLEAWAQAEHSPELRRQLIGFYERDRQRGTEAVRMLFPSLDEQSARAWSSLYLALADGMVVQWLFDPEGAPSGSQLAAGMRAIAASLEAAEGERGESPVTGPRGVR